MCRAIYSVIIWINNKASVHLTNFIRRLLQKPPSTRILCTVNILYPSVKTKTTIRKPKISKPVFLSIWRHVTQSFYYIEIFVTIVLRPAYLHRWNWRFTLNTKRRSRRTFPYLFTLLIRIFSLWIKTKNTSLTEHGTHYGILLLWWNWGIVKRKLQNPIKKNNIFSIFYYVHWDFPISFLGWEMVRQTRNVKQGII